MSGSKSRYVLELPDGRIYARVTYRDRFGKRREIHRRAATKTQAREFANDIISELKREGGDLMAARHMTFRELADYYESKFLIPAEYIDAKKVRGLRSFKSGRSLIKPLKEYFDSMKIQSILYDDIAVYAAKRLREDTRRGETRAVASVNRELSVLRRMLRIAYRNRWIVRNPFDDDEALISPSSERHRDRLLSWEEEQRLLAACVGKAAHIKPIIICAFDSGMRRGEILKLTWRDIDLDKRLLRVIAFNTKTARERWLAISDRLFEVLNTLWAVSTKDIDSLVFGIKDNFNHAFASVRKDSQLYDVHFHDIRHTFATRLIQSGMPMPQVARILGHTQQSTTFRYVNIDEETIRKAADMINTINNRMEYTPEKPVIN